MAKDSEHKLDKERTESKVSRGRGIKGAGSLRPEDAEKPKADGEVPDRRVKVRVDSLAVGDIFLAAGQTFTFDGLLGDKAKVILMTEADVGGGKIITYGIERLEFPCNTLVIKK